MVKTHKLRHYNAFDVALLVLFSLLVLISLLPMCNIISLSVSDDYSAIHNKGMLFPDFDHISGDAYRAVFNSKAVYTSFGMSVLITVVSTAVHLLVTAMAGFALSERELPGRTAMIVFILITMLFGGGLIPTYLTISSYGLIDSFWVFVLPGAAGGYSIILMKNYIVHIPSSLKEAAEIDGANPVFVLVRIILPLSLPILATLGLFAAVGKWNDWFTGFIYIKQNKWLWPFQNVLQNLVVNTETGNVDNVDLSSLGEAFKNALIVISIVPMVAVYLVAQKYFVQGLFVGSVKE